MLPATMREPEDRIPFNRPVLTGRELEYVRQAVDGMHTSGDGPFTARCARLLESEIGAERVILTPSCTDALEMCALLLDVGPADEVILPSFAFVSTASAFALRGARPVFVDVREDTLNLDESKIEERVTSRTRVIVALHYAGVACAMDPIRACADRRGVAVVEDNAHGLFGRYRGRPLGSLGALGALSFHETKNLTCGEGGALVLNDPALVPRAEIVRDKGTNRQQLFRGQVDRYTWVDLGSSFVLSDLLAAFLWAQLESRREIAARRAERWQAYDAALRGWIERYGVSLPCVPAECEPTHHLFHMLLPTREERDALLAHLKRDAIDAVFHYSPLHLSPMGRAAGGRPGDCPVAERTSDRLVRLPLYNDLAPRDQERVVDSIRRFFSGART
jgi:dTDP-4-amino-4,6-dideoxygalactose transaminase